MHLAVAVVALAQALVAAQVHCSRRRALELMLNTADATGEDVDYIAKEIVTGRVSFLG
jgi:hypothetical protein